MTRTTNARLAGATMLLYIAAGMSSLVLAGSPGATDLLALLRSLSALVLGVTFYAITRDEDPDIALLALACRVLEAVPGEGTIFFAVGSTLFSWLLLRGRMIPTGLGWLGVAASALLVIVLPLTRSGVLGGPLAWTARITWMVYLPALVFQLALAVWLLTKGVAAPSPSGRTRQSDRPAGV